MFRFAFVICLLAIPAELSDRLKEPSIWQLSLWIMFFGLLLAVALGRLQGGDE